jgi:PKD repeat protein
MLASDGVTMLERVNLKFPYRTANNVLSSVNLSNTDGQKVGNAVTQSELLGYTATSFPYTLGTMTDPTTAGVAKPAASFSWSADAAASRKVNFDASATTCPSNVCTYTWTFGGAGTPDLADPVRPSFLYDTAGTYTVALSVTDTVTGLSSTTSSSVSARTLNTAPAASATVSVSGMTVTVADTSTDREDGQSALAVTVTWGDGTSTTQAAGTNLTKTYTSAGTYTVTHRVVDSGGLAASADLSPSDTTTLNARVAVPDRYSVSGTVTRANGSALSGVAIYLRQAGALKYIGSTGTTGTYTINNVAAGTYDVVPAKAGYTFTPASRSVTVGPNATGIDFQSNQ